jgi:hypothetical protein
MWGKAEITSLAAFNVPMSEKIASMKDESEVHVFAKSRTMFAFNVRPFSFPA